MATLAAWVIKSKFRTILMGLLIPSIPLLLLAGFLYVTLSDNMGALLTKKIEVVTTNAVERIETAIARDIAVAQIFATRPHLLLMMAQGDVEGMNSHLHHLFVHSEHVERISIVATDGIQVANYPFTPDTLGVNFSHRDYFLGVSRHWQPYVSEFFLRTAEPRRYVFSISVPLKQAGVPVGVLNMQPKADYFHQLLQGLLMPEGHIIVVDGKGALVYSSLEGEFTELKDLSATYAVQKLLQGLSGFEETIDVETGEPVFTSYRVVGDYGWGVIVDVPTEVVLAPLTTMLRWTFAVTLFLLIAGGVCGYGAGLLLESRKNASIRLQEQAKDLALLNQRLVAASAAKSSFLANVSHELRTPLNSIIGFSQILEDGLAGKLSEKQAEYVGYVLASGTHLLSLIDDILDLSKVEAGKLELEVTKFSVRSPIEAIVSQMGARCREKNIELTVEIAPHEVELEADERKFRQILLNLLSNAVKFTPEGGAIAVRATLVTMDGTGASTLAESPAPPARDGLEVAVSDTGIGIKAEDLDKLFQPFSQLESTYTKNYRDTGLGLALTKKFVELHSGIIWVESEFGRGSTFTFVVPIKRLVRERAISV